MKALAICAGALSLAACSSRPLQEVPVACIEKMPERPPVYADGEIASMPAGLVVKALHADRLSWRHYALELEAVAGPCVKT